MIRHDIIGVRKEKVILIAPALEYYEQPLLIINSEKRISGYWNTILRPESLVSTAAKSNPSINSIPYKHFQVTYGSFTLGPTITALRRIVIISG